jgi:septum formation protein
MTPMVLASTSPYRRELLEKLGIPFKTQAPKFDEETLKKNIADPINLAQTLARLKAESLATLDNCVIGGDQVVALENEILGKPGSFEKACAQLTKMQGRKHRLVTALHVIHRGDHYPLLDITEIEMRSLSPEQIQAYVRRDQALDCAGSYKIEKSGMTLMKQMKSQDFSSIQGLPLIQLTDLLISLGYRILDQELK